MTVRTFPNNVIMFLTLSANVLLGLETTMVQTNVTGMESRHTICFLWPDLKQNYHSTSIETVLSHKNTEIRFFPENASRVMWF